MGRESLKGGFQLTLTALKTIPDPITSVVVGLITAIWEAVDSAKQNRNQIQLLFQRICAILQSLKIPTEYSNEAMRSSVDLLKESLQSILNFILNEQKKSFLKSVLTADDLKFQIEEQERLIWTACFAFQNAALLAQDVKLHDLFALAEKHRNESNEANSQQKAYLQDISEKLDTMRSATVNTQFLDALLDTFSADPVKQITAMRVVLDRDDSGLGAVKLSRDERAFFKAGVARLTAQASLMSDIKIKTWTVTSFEVERGFLLGSDTTSRVRVGRWLGKLVGILEMKDGEVVHRIIKTWKTLRSPLIQTFLGASTVDEPPFLLLPHSTGNIMEYISRQTETPNYGRLAHDIIRGLEYLHTRQPPIVHGNLRPTVVQVDAQGNAVLSSVGLKTSDLSMSAEEATRFEHDLNIWRAPEVVAGESCTEASDVFAWGRIVRAMIEHLEEFHQFSPPLDGKELLQRLCDSATHADPSSRPTASKIVEQILGLSDVAPTSEYSLLLTHSLMDEGGMADPAMDRWRFVPCSRHQYGEITSEYDVLYLKTRPISGLGDHPLRQLSFEIRCHDQGKEATSADPRDGTWAWVEIAILRSNDSGDTYEVNLEEDLPNGHYRGHMVANTRHEIMRLPFADNTPRIHHIVLNQTHPFVRAVRKGDCVALYPKAMFPGWENHIYSAEIHAVMEP